MRRIIFQGRDHARHVPFRFGEDILSVVCPNCGCMFETTEVIGEPGKMSFYCPWCRRKIQISIGEEER